MPPRKYSTDEERKQAKRDNVRRYKLRMREKLIEEQGQPKRGRPVIYQSDEERIEAKKRQVCECAKRYYWKNIRTDTTVV